MTTEVVTESTPLPALDDWLCLALYTASRTMIGRYRTLLDPLGLTYPQFLVLTALRERSPLSVADIGRQLQLESSTLSPLIKRLEKFELVHRSRSSQDERSVEVALTDRGAELAIEGRRVAAQVRTATGLSDPARQRLVDQLHRLTADLERD